MKKKKRSRCIVGTVGLGILSVIIYFVAIFNLFPKWTFFIYFPPVIFGLIRFTRRPVTISHDEIETVLSKYQAKHPIDYLVTGGKLKNMKDVTWNQEFSQYAPERILIVERNDMAEMMILNRYHFDHKTLVLSQEKYPEPAFHACRQFLNAHPDLPIFLIHDASIRGRRMRENLLADPDWQLRGKNIKDLGLFPEDVDRMKQPIWMPHKKLSLRKNDKILSGGSALDNVQNGYWMPVDIAPPKAMMTMVTIAAAAGAALLSEELIAEQTRSASLSGNGGCGGCGGCADGFG